MLGLALSACKGESAPSCPDEPPGGSECPSYELSCTYDRDGGRTLTCICTSTGWRCNDCPEDFMSPTATCTPGERCFYEDWEHGCACECNDQGSWYCIPETTGSICPMGADAGP
jgi:hypothetical protein